MDLLKVMNGTVKRTWVNNNSDSMLRMKHSARCRVNGSKQSGGSMKWVMRTAIMVGMVAFVRSASGSDSRLLLVLNDATASKDSIWDLYNQEGDEFGLALEIRDDRGRYPIHIAALNVTSATTEKEQEIACEQFCDLVDPMDKIGFADYVGVDGQRQTALHYLAKRTSGKNSFFIAKPIAKFVMEYGKCAFGEDGDNMLSILNKKDHRGRTAEDIAKERGSGIALKALQRLRRFAQGERERACGRAQKSGLTWKDMEKLFFTQKLDDDSDDSLESQGPRGALRGMITDEAWRELRTSTKKPFKK